jgi:HSP20 family protein
MRMLSGQPAVFTSIFFSGFCASAVTMDDRHGLLMLCGAATEQLDREEVVMVDVPVAANKEAATTTPARTTSDPFRALRNEMDRLFDRFAVGVHLPSWRGMFGAEPAGRIERSFTFSAPAVDVTEDEKAYKITAEMPGLDDKNVEVTIAGDLLTLKGEKRHESEEKDKNHYVSERAYGSFQRCFALPDSVDRDKITADLSKGHIAEEVHKSTD